MAKPNFMRFLGGKDTKSASKRRISWMHGEGLSHRFDGLNGSAMGKNRSTDYTELTDLVNSYLG